MMNTQEFNEIVFDGMLTLAAKELFQEEVNEFDAIPDERHEFSSQFKKRMKKILKKQSKLTETGYKSIMTVSKRVAVVILIILSITCVRLLTVEAVRVELYKIVTTFFEKYIDISFIGESGALPQDAEKITEVYLPSYIPERFAQNEVISNAFFVSTEYINTSNALITYSQGLTQSGFSIDGEDYSMRDISINGCKGQIYEYNKEGHQAGSYTIIWNDEKYYYKLIGNIEIDELLKMANSLEIQK